MFTAYANIVYLLYLCNRNFFIAEVCESAAMVVNICKNQYRIEITKFRSEEFCSKYILTKTLP